MRHEDCFEKRLHLTPGKFEEAVVSLVAFLGQASFYRLRCPSPRISHFTTFATLGIGAERGRAMDRGKTAPPEAGPSHRRQNAANAKLTTPASRRGHRPKLQ